MRLLLVEDNERLCALTRSALEKAGYAIDAVSTAGDAEAALGVVAYPLMVLDLGLPDRDGVDLLRDLRSTGKNLPILVLTSRGGVLDRVAGLDAGADDYLVKPFAMEELVARIRVLLRRPGELTRAVLTLGPLSLEVHSRQIEVAGEVRPLPPREGAVLEILLRRAGKVVPKKLVEDQLFGLSGEGGANAVEVYVHRLRRFLSDYAPALQIHTVRGVGYLLSETKPCPARSGIG